MARADPDELMTQTSPFWSLGAGRDRLRRPREPGTRTTAVATSPWVQSTADSPAILCINRTAAAPFPSANSSTDSTGISRDSASGCTVSQHRT